jgi:hypothetical protein
MMKRPVKAITEFVRSYKLLCLAIIAMIAAGALEMTRQQHYANWVL